MATMSGRFFCVLVVVLIFVSLASNVLPFSWEKTPDNELADKQIAGHLLFQRNLSVVRNASQPWTSGSKRAQQQDASSQQKVGRLLPIQLTAIHVDRAEFPLSKFVFQLTLRLALEAASKQMEREHRVKLVLSIRSANTCSHQFAGAIAAEEYYTKRARLFIVSGCDDAIRGVSRLASLWQVPVMTAAGFGADLNNKSVHRTLVRVAFSLRAAVDFLFRILKTFQWRRVNLIVDESDPNSLALRGSIEDHLANDSAVALNTIALDLKTLAQSSGAGPNNGSKQLEPVDQWPGELMERVVADALGQCAKFSRVSVLLIPQQYLRKFMLSVYEQNMANGLYTFITLPLLVEAPANSDEPATATTTTTGLELSSPEPKGQQTINSGDNLFLWRAARSQRNAHAKQAFESLMSIYLKIPTTKAYLYFASRLAKLASTGDQATGEPMAISFNETAGGEQRARLQPAARKLQLNVNPYLASFYDSVQIYVGALNESLWALKRKQRQQMESKQQQQQLRVRHPKALNLHAEISELVRNRHFDNMITGHIYINSNGDRETDYTLDDMNHMMGTFAPVILYRGESRTIERLARIHWSSDQSVGPTSDLVDCSLTQTCPSRPMSKIVFVMILFACLVIVSIGSLGTLVYRHLSFESQLVDYWWKVHMNEIEIVLTRRKNANDGSIVMNSTVVGDGAAGTIGGGGGGGGGTMSGTGVGEHAPGSISSHDHSPASGARSRGALDGGQPSGTDSVTTRSGLGGVTMMIASGSGFKTSHAASAADESSARHADRPTDFSRTTKDTGTGVGQWGQTSSFHDVCYGNITLGLYKQSKVALKPIAKFHHSRKLMVELRSIKDINHTNLCRFVGIIVDEGSWGIVNEFCPKGSLLEFFNNESMVIDWTFKYSIINDIMAGLTYLHSSPLGYHGRLKSSNCLINARFVVKLSDYGPHSLYEQIDSAKFDRSSVKRSNELLLNRDTDDNDCDDNAEADNGDQKVAAKSDDGESEWLRKRIWLAPEHMPQSSKNVGSMKGDMYSFGLLLFQIITNNLPFFDHEKNDFVLPLKTLYQELKNHGPDESTGPNTVDMILSDGEQNIEPLVELMKSCWNFEPSKRPPIQLVNSSLKKITRGVTSKKLLENLTSRMEQYTNNLESLIEAKLTTLVEEKLKTEELLYQFVPKSIAALLKEGQFIEPEAFECVTVFYSDIVGFTSLSAESSPIELVDFLSDLYLCFDETLEQHDIYKVDTIGDAYIVASGLPQRNDGKHIIEIACAALELRDRLRCFKIPHKPGRSLEMRVGIHSGSCIAGIVGGLNMPKYCVFGETLTIGKFMEANGLPMKIHITEESKTLLAGLDGFTIETREPKITRDGLPFQTYWLEKDDKGAY